MPQVRGALAHALERPAGVRRLAVELAEDTRVSVLSAVAELEDDAKVEEVSAQLRKTERLGSASAGGWRRLAMARVELEQVLSERARTRALSLFATGRLEPQSRGPDEDGLEAMKVFEKDVLTWDRAREVLVVPFVRTNRGDEEATAVAPPPVRNVTLDKAALDAIALGPAVGETRRFALDNGLTVVLSRRPAIPVVGVALGLPGRALHAPRSATAFASWLMSWDFTREDAVVGLPVVDVGADSTVVALSGPSFRLPLMLDVLGHNLPPRVAWFAADQINEAIDRLERDPKDAEASAVRERASDAVRTRALAGRVMPSTSSEVAVKLGDLRPVEREAVVELVDVAWRPGGAWLVVEGDLDLEPTERVVRELFADWRPGSAPAPRRTPAAPPPRPPRPEVVENQDAATTRVRFACRLPAGGTPDALGGVALLEYALGAWFEDDLRRELGLTYGVSVWTSRHVHEENLLSLTVTLVSANGQAALRRFLTKLNDLDGAVWEEPRVDVARWRLARERLATGQRSSDLAAELAAMGAAGFGSEVVLDWPRVLARAPLRAVDDAWMSCNDTWAMEIEGERTSIEAALRATPRPAGLGR